MPTAAGNNAAASEFFGGPAWKDNGSVSGNVQPDLSQYFFQSFTLAGNITLLWPAVPPARFARLIFKFVQDATGSRTVTFSGAYRDAPSLGSSGPAGSVATLEFVYDGGSYQFMGGSTTFAASNAALTLAPNAGGITFSGAPPTVYAITRVPTVGAITIAGIAPTFAQNASYIQPQAGSVTLLGGFPVRSP